MGWKIKQKNSSCWESILGLLPWAASCWESILGLLPWAASVLQVSSQDPTLSQGETVWWTKSNFLSWCTLLQQCNLGNIQNFLWTNHSKKKIYIWIIEWTRTHFTVVRKSLHNNYWFCNLIGLYHFWLMSPRNLISFARPFLAGRCVWAGHETNVLRMFHWATSTGQPRDLALDGGKT